MADLTPQAFSPSLPLGGGEIAVVGAVFNTIYMQREKYIYIEYMDNNTQNIYIHTYIHITFAMRDKGIKKEQK